MDISAAALPPRQPAILPSDRQHPRFAAYMQMRAGFSAKLIEAPSFSDWLACEQRQARHDELAADPQFPAFQRWMRETRGGGRPCPAGNSFPANFTFWREGGRW